MRKINKTKANGSWIEFPDDPTFKLKVRPINLLSLNKMPTEEVKTTQNEMFEWFDYVLIDWTGYEDESGAVIKCDKENKELVFNYDQDVVTFVINTATKLRDEIITKEEIDNLKKVVSSETQEKEDK